ncbi:MAG: carbohydrate-binding protein, partial [Planctomycetota bacterium]
VVFPAHVSKGAPMGTAFTYQGRLIDANNPADGLYDLTFRLYESNVGETRAANDVNVGDVNVSDGYFTVELDFGDGAFDGDGRWLEIGVRPGEMNDPNVYTTLSPRQEVTPTPYALQTRGIFVDNSGNVGIGTKFPDKKLTVADGGFAVYPGPVGLSDPIIITDDLDIKLGDIGGMQNEVSLVISDSDNKFVFNNGNVGIGTTEPSSRLDIKASSGTSAGGLRITSSTNNNQVINLQDATPGDRGQISVRAGGSDKIVLRANGNTYFNGGKVGIGTTNPQADMDVRHSPGSHRVIKATASDGSELFYVAEHPFGNGYLGIMDGAGASKVFITANGNSYFKGGKVGIGTDTPESKLEVAGWTRTQALEITGGSDLAEPFDIGGEATIEPGMVVSIDPERPGRLMMSNTAYDRKVAGIVSGAGGIKVGMVMGQKGSEVDGSELIALTGRVYCWADASSESIEPGDLLTTSDIPGHAMKVNDYTKAQGAIIGKAMSSLEKGRGLVLVLVTLQ